MVYFFMALISQGLLPRSLLRNKLSEAGANTPLLAAGKFIGAENEESRHRQEGAGKVQRIY